ncbi:MAG: hypothetical protein P4L46_06700 [Fimbriimonas sp.]|nr:hypothetical protein [Fimbriimonas sp.]
MIALIVFATCISLLPSALGQEVHRRLDRQHMRINQGLRTGKLNHNQAKRLRETDTKVHARAVRDRKHNKGRLTPAQRHRLNHTLDKNSRRIWKDKHSKPKH